MRAADFDIDFGQGSPEHLRAAEGGWSENGPILRNRPEGRVDTHYWTLLEAIVWVATRDERAIAGAAGYLNEAEQAGSVSNAGIAAQILLSTDLRIDVAGHHLNCPAMWDRKPCGCAQLGRVRYCTCPPTKQIEADWCCPCTDNAIAEVERALRDGFSVAGQRDGQDLFEAVPLAAFAGARRWFDRTGIRFVPGFVNLRLRIEDVKARWPEAAALPAHLTPTQSTAPGRPGAYPRGLAIYRARIDQGMVIETPRAEAQEVLATLKKDKAVAKPPGLGTVEGWLRPFHGHLAWDRGQATNAPEIIARIDAFLEEKRRDAAGRGGR